MNFSFGLFLLFLLLRIYVLDFRDKTKLKQQNIYMNTYCLFIKKLELHESLPCERNNQNNSWAIV